MSDKEDQMDKGADELKNTQSSLESNEKVDFDYSTSERMDLSDQQNEDPTANVEITKQITPAEPIGGIQVSKEVLKVPRRSSARVGEPGKLLEKIYEKDRVREINPIKGDDKFAWDWVPSKGSSGGIIMGINKEKFDCINVLKGDKAKVEQIGDKLKDYMDIHKEDVLCQPVCNE
uniref:Uncharacterized protein n=1 Tax=Arundo donax TaxID=35708 RepID=A0A0A9TUI1_ARUDO